MTIRQPHRSWKSIAAAGIAAILATMLFAALLPWLALFAGLALLAGGIAYAAWPPMSERIASLRSLPNPPPQSRIYIGAPIIIYGIVLLALSQSQIRANWQNAEVRAEVASEIERANTALEQEQIGEVLAICNALDSKANSDERIQLDAIRTRAQAIEDAHRTELANAKVLQLVSDGRIHLIRKKLDHAQAALVTALHVPMATEFGRATELANEVVAARTKLASEFLENDITQSMN